MDKSNLNQENYLSVSQITSYIGKKFSKDPYLDQVNIKGEITNFRERSNGHQYFSLKDDNAKIGVTLFRNVYQKINFKIKDGDLVACRGRINIYPPHGTYSLIVESIEPYGLGTLLRELQERKARLEKKGIFDSKRKRSICSFPRRIAVITSPSGAVIRDIITTTRRRFPLVKLILFPAVVQGEKAASSVFKQLERANEMNNFDNIIIARGGGSFEDLWPFNDEKLTVAVAKSKIPVITSIGHETDTTLVDYAADLRAPTPTAAAELATPRLDQLKQLLQQRRIELRQAEIHYLTNLKAKIRPLTKSYLFRRPEAFYQNQAITLDRLKERLNQEEKHILNEQVNQVVQLQKMLKSVMPQHLILQLREKNTQELQNLNREVKVIIHNKKIKLQNLSQNLLMLNPHRVLERGYGIVENDKHQVIDRVNKTKLNDKLKLILTDGVVYSTVNQIEGDSNANKKIE